MNDLEYVQDLMPEVALPAAERLAPARERLLAQARAPRRAGRRGPRRYLVGGATIAAVAAGVAVALAVAPGSAGVPTRAPGSAAPVGLTPQLILARAVTAANARPDVVPRPDQFAYVRWTGPTGTAQVWTPVDGTRDGRVSGVDGNTHRPYTEIVPGCRGGQAQYPYNPGEPRVPGTFPCRPALGEGLGYDPALPTRPAGALAYLRAHGGGDGSLGGIARVFARISQSAYLRPAQQAALFRGLGTLPGMTGVPDAVDGAGRHGVGLAWTSSYGDRVVLVFDKVSYDFMGLVVYDRGGRPRSGLAVQAVAVVDRVGQTR